MFCSNARPCMWYVAPRLQHNILYVLSKDKHSHIMFLCSNACPPIWYAAAVLPGVCNIVCCMFYPKIIIHISCLFCSNARPCMWYAAVLPRVYNILCFIQRYNSIGILCCCVQTPPLPLLMWDAVCLSHFLPMHVVNLSPPKESCQWHGCHILVTVCYKLSHSHVMF